MYKLHMLTDRTCRTDSVPVYEFMKHNFCTLYTEYTQYGSQDIYLDKYKCVGQIVYVKHIYISCRLYT